MSMKQLFRAAAAFAAIPGFLLVAAVAMAADPTPADTPAAGQAVLGEACASGPADVPQATPSAQTDAAAVQTDAPPAQTDAGAPAAATGVVPDPAKKDGDAMISQGQEMAIQGAKTGDPQMVRAGRRMIRDGALLKRAQQMAR